MRALSKPDQAAFSGLRVAAYRLALLVGNGLLIKLAGRVSWFACFLAAGGILLSLCLVHAVMLPGERREEARAVAAGEAGERRAASVDFVEAFRSFFAQPGIVFTLPFIVLYRAGDALMFAMNAPFQKALGLATEARGDLGVLTTIASIVGAIAGGAVVARLDLKRSLVPIAALQSVAILLYVALAAAPPSRPWIFAIMIAEQLVAGVGSAAFMVFLMRRASGAYKASHFAIASALMSLATTGVGTASGYLAERVGFTAFFAVAFAASLPGVALSRFVPKD